MGPVEGAGQLSRPARRLVRPEPWMPAIVLVTGIGPFATDSYLAALPRVQRSLSTSATAASLTVTAFLVGLAVGQLVAGPVSDGTGRRRPVMLGALAFTLLSAVCAVAPDAALLITARLLQGLAGGAAIAVGRAVISDRYGGAEAAARYGTLAGITLIAPVVAPAAGSALLDLGSWRVIFGFMVALGALMLAGALVGVPETLGVAQRQPSTLRQAGTRILDLLRDRAFLVPMLVQSLATAGFFVYIGGSSFVLQSQLGLSQGRYTLVFASDAAVMVAATWAFRALVPRRGAPALRSAGLAASTVAAMGLLTLALTSRALGHAAPSLAGTWLLLLVAVAGMGWCIPGSTVIGQGVGRRSGGTASALMGGVPFVAGSLTIPLTGLLGHQTVAVMAAAMSVLLAAAVAVDVWDRLDRSHRHGARVT